MKKIKMLIISAILMLNLVGINYQVNATNTTKEDTKNIQITYSYKEDTNSVIAQVKSKNKLKNTKVNWELSKDGLTYTYEFFENTKYETTFEDVSGNKTNININITQIQKRPLKLDIEYKVTDTNSVIVNLKSNNKLKDTKINWNLSKDDFMYTYEFYENTNYESTFEDILGNKAKVKINVTQIQKRKLELDVEYKKTNNNSFIVNIKSNNRLKDTKINWNLSKDLFTYTYEFLDNTNYNTEFEDIFGNKQKVNIKIEGLDKTGPVLKIKYEYDFNSNSVKATITSNEELKASKINWTLSKDKLSYTYVFKDNTNYTTSFQDKWGNSTNINIVVKDIDKEAPKISLQYVHDDDNSVTVKMVLN